jgi:hypothetical protein
MRPTLTLIALMLMLSVSAFAQIAAVPQQMNFQGRLTRPDGTPVPNGNYSIRFSLWTAASGGTEKWNQTINPVAVRNGTFSVRLNTSTGAADKFNGNLFLEIKIGTNAPLTPRQPLVSVAYAMKADSVKDNAITSASIANGTITSADLASSALSLSWLLNGNANPSASSFLGTTTNHPLSLKVNNRRAMQYLYAENATNPDFIYRSINIFGGSEINSISGGVIGGTIAGGGRDFVTGGNDSPNTINADFGTIGGGFGNTANSLAATVAGGRGNTAGGFSATVAGGNTNFTSANEATIGGGHNNTANGVDATIGGGAFNIASGFRATVPGGNNNTAQGDYSFAAGNLAQALHPGSFVWADSQNAVFASTGPDQFLVRATGGLLLQGNTHLNGITRAEYSLTVDNGNISGGAVSNGLRFGPFSGEGISSRRIAGGNQFGLELITNSFSRMSITNAGDIGIGTNAPVGALHVRGFQGAFNLEGTSEHVYMQFFPRGVGQGRKAYLGFASAGTHDLTIANEDGGAVQVIGPFINNSDARWKTNVAALPDALESVLALRGVSYDWRQDLPDQHFSKQRQIGFIAQEVEKVLPELVYTDGKGYKSVAYVNVVPVLVEAVKNLKTQKDTEVKALKTEIAELKALVQRLAEQQKAGQK